MKINPREFFAERGLTAMPIRPALRTPLVRLAINYPDAWVSTALRRIFRRQIEYHEAVEECEQRNGKSYAQPS